MASHLIDTNSLLNLALYYHPFDAAGQLYKHVEARFNSRDWLLLESVHNELETQRNGLTLLAYPFLNHLPVTAPRGIPISSAQHHNVQSNWINQKTARKIRTDYLKASIAELTQQRLEQALGGTPPSSEDLAASTASIKQHAEADAERKYRQKYQSELRSQLRKADFQLILTAKPLNATIVTEETPWANDGKLFKKIPAIAKLENIPCITLPELLKGSGIPLTM